jgi:hypothetical protein
VLFLLLTVSVLRAENWQQHLAVKLRQPVNQVAYWQRQPPLGVLQGRGSAANGNERRAGLLRGSPVAGRCGARRLVAAVTGASAPATVAAAVAASAAAASAAAGAAEGWSAAREGARWAALKGGGAGDTPIGVPGEGVWDGCGG